MLSSEELWLRKRSRLLQANIPQLNNISWQNSHKLLKLCQRIKKKGKSSSVADQKYRIELKDLELLLETTY